MASFSWSLGRSVTCRSVTCRYDGQVSGALTQRPSLGPGRSLRPGSLKQIPWVYWREALDGDQQYTLADWSLLHRAPRRKRGHRVSTTSVGVRQCKGQRVYKLRVAVTSQRAIRVYGRFPGPAAGKTSTTPRRVTVTETDRREFQVTLVREEQKGPARPYIIMQDPASMRMRRRLPGQAQSSRWKSFASLSGHYILQQEVLAIGQNRKTSVVPMGFQVISITSPVS
ncbi:hypothetical protein B0T19DRAFT_44671 [Cercophora scortea]|uniref:Uncharacterized protein n=1 Tax=Cercophora scortea TaxID=314031 RepID=A0AAE0J497_9PEZI|nr:hypothetical protein B0T19DRAFT_44671 [Cercophora scortea]